MATLEELITQIEELEAQVRDLNIIKRDIYQSIKSDGFDTKAVRKVIRVKKNRKKYLEEVATVELYLDQVKE
jgi:uncharacterized protein (UPF0335 family)